MNSKGYSIYFLNNKGIQLDNRLYVNMDENLNDPEYLTQKCNEIIENIKKFPAMGGCSLLESTNQKNSAY